MHPQFWKDLGQERLLHPMLDRVYSSYGIRVKRFADPELQTKGIDLVLSKGRRTYLVDEKAQLHYIGKKLPTCAFEIGILVNGKPKVGWLLDVTKRTEVYALVCDIQLHHADPVIRFASDVASAEVVLVNRARLVRALAENGVARGFLHELAGTMRSSGQLRVELPYPGMRLVRSPHLKEDPINLVVPRSFLRSIGQVVHS